MADVIIICVREDIERAEALAETFDDFGFSVSDWADDSALQVCGAAVVLWSDAAQASPELTAAVARVVATGKEVVLSLSPIAPPDGATMCFDMTEWNSDPDDASLDRLFFALDRMVIGARHSRPVEMKVAPKAKAIVARIAPHVTSAAPAPALRLMATSLLVIGAVLAAGVAIGGPRENRAPVQAATLQIPAERNAPVTLADVAPRGRAYDLAAVPVNDAPVGRRGLEPPSAASVR